MKRRKRSDDDRNQGPVVALGRVWRVPAFLARWLSGAEVARARFGRWCGTWEPLASICLARGLGGWREGELQAADLRGESTDAGQRGGPPRSSGEGPVMGLERRGRIVRVRLVVNRGFLGGAR
jgi:hypothetical protein